MANFDLKQIQKIIRSMNLDGWLFYDFRGSNDLALNILNIPKESHLTRRFYYFIPKLGLPKKIVNAIEPGHLDHLPGKKLIYADHDSLAKNLRSVLKNVKTAAMEYSPNNKIPYVSKIDAGVLEQIKSFGVKVKSSGDLISMFTAVWSKQQLSDNLSLAKDLTKIVNNSLNYIKNKYLSSKTLTEYDVQQFIMDEFGKRNYFTDFPPIVGVNENSANPHYAPTKSHNKKIRKGDFVLIDLWAKKNKPDSVWADITWTGFMGNSVPEKYSRIFNIVANARNSTFNFIKDRIEKGQKVKGFEADRIARKVITDAGYGKYFIHRTGHSITTDLHGSGAHLDNFETVDERLLLPSTSFSIEPGIYFKGDFGVRSEIDVYIKPDRKVIPTGKVQNEVIPILL
jgi:Xaa-Pro aminopeptidase